MRSRLDRSVNRLFIAHQRASKLDIDTTVTWRNELKVFARSNDSDIMEKVMTTAVQLDDTRVELSQPLKHRPDVILVTTSDGRRAILGDGQDPFSIDEYRQFSEAKSSGDLQS